MEPNDDVKLLPPPKSRSPLFSTGSPCSSPDRGDRRTTTTKKNFSPPFSSPQHRSQSLLETNGSPLNKNTNLISVVESTSKKRKKPKDSTSASLNNNLLVKKRAKTKSDSGMDSDYSGTNNASPVEPPSSVENLASTTSSLFSPDSARSVDTVLHESPASSAGSAASTSNVVNGGATMYQSNHNDVASSSSTKPKSSSKDNNTVVEPRLNSLMSLQRKIMTVREQSVAQKIADIIVSAQQTSYECTSENFEFDLYKLDTNIINSLFKCFDSTTTTTSSSSAATSGRCN